MTKLRVFVVLAAVFLVVAVALGSILPPDEPLSQVLAQINAGWVARLQDFELQRLGGWAWQGITVPLLVRPIWLTPLALGVICLGVVTTLSWRRTPRRRGS